MDVYMSESEREWAKEHGLKRTNLYCTAHSGRSRRIVYRANDGRLFYRDHNVYCNIPESYCYSLSE